MIIPGVIGRIAKDSTKPYDDRSLGAGIPEPSDKTAQTILLNGFACAATRGWTASDGGLHCAATGNLEWLTLELADVQLKRDPARALLQAYRQHGADLLTHLGGRFAILVWDSTSKTGLIARDRFGQVSVYWKQTANGDLLFAPVATAINRMDGGNATLSMQAVFNYFYFHMVPSPHSAFEGVNKLPAAHALFANDGRWQVKRYWTPDFRENADTSMADAGKEMLGLLSSSVARLTDGADTGAFLSGGLDSSTVAGLLAKRHANPKTYSIGFNAEGYDEIAYAKIASDRFSTVFNSYYVTPEDVLSELPRIAAAYDEPFGNSSALPAYFCARFAADDGRQRLLAGDGGDELFAGNERYAKQTVFELYARLPKWSRRFWIEPLMHNLLSDALPGVAKVRSYVRQANIPLPDRLHTYNILNRIGTERVIDAHLLDCVDAEQPLQLDRDLYREPGSASRLNRFLFLDWHHTLADNDLRKVNRMCELAGIEVEYPMLDDRLVEFSTRVSSNRKMRANRLRSFYKRAVKDLLPAEIINKPKHGFGLPFGVWMEQHPGLQALANDNLSRMRQRRYIRPDFIDEVQRLHREQHAGYYGEFIWAAIMLELWLTAQGIEP